MASGMFTLDFLIDVIEEIHRDRYVVITQFTNRTETQRILSGLIRLGVVKKCGATASQLAQVRWPRIGRHPTVYTLAKPYETLRLGDVYSLVPQLSGLRLRLCYLGRDILLSRLAKIKIPDASDIVANYSPEILLCGLNNMSLSTYRRHGAIDEPTFQWGDRQWSSDMTAIGVVKNKYGLGYKLAVPLTKVKIATLLRYLCYRSSRKKTYNRLFYLFKQRSVSILLPPYEAVN